MPKFVVWPKFNLDTTIPLCSNRFAIIMPVRSIWHARNWLNIIIKFHFFIGSWNCSSFQINQRSCGEHAERSKSSRSISVLVQCLCVFFFFEKSFGWNSSRIL